jgi:AhpD family alkylhydroperoxidase
MTVDFIDLHQHIQERLGELGSELPGPMSGFARLHKKAVETGALDAKTKELMALAIGIAVRCEGCIAYHTHDAIQAGATRQEGAAGNDRRSYPDGRRPGFYLCNPCHGCHRPIFGSAGRGSRKLILRVKDKKDGLLFLNKTNPDNL